MRAYRDEAPVAARADRRGIFVIAVVGAAVVILTLLYFGLRDTAEPAPETPLQVVRDVEAVAPQPGNTVAVQPPAVQEAAPAAADFTERQLGPPSTTVGAGEAPAANPEENGEVFVIEGELLEQLEAEADAESAAEAAVE